MGRSGDESEHHYVGAEFCSSGACVEVARLRDRRVALRSSRDPGADPVIVSDDEWREFVSSVKAGLFDLL